MEIGAVRLPKILVVFWRGFSGPLSSQPQVLKEVSFSARRASRILNTRGVSCFDAFNTINTRILVHKTCIVLLEWCSRLFTDPPYLAS